MIRNADIISKNKLIYLFKAKLVGKLLNFDKFESVV